MTLRQSGIRKNQKTKLFETWIRFRGEVHVISQHEHRGLMVAVESLSSTIVSSVEFGFVPSHMEISCLEQLGLDTVTALERILAVTLDASVLYELEESENQRRTEQQVTFLLRQAEERTALKLSLPQGRVRIQRESVEYPTVPTCRVPATLEGTDIPESPGVYFVWNGESISYFGQSRVLRRRATISHDRIVLGNWLSFLEFPELDLLYAESYYIGICRPVDNFTSHRTSSLDLVTKG